jgi:hypothetical protein
MLRFVIDETGVDIVGVGKIGRDTSFDEAKGFFREVCKNDLSQLGIEPETGTLIDMAHGITVCFHTKTNSATLCGVSVFDGVPDVNAQTLELFELDMLRLSAAQLFAALKAKFADAAGDNGSLGFEIQTQNIALDAYARGEVGSDEYNLDPIQTCLIGYLS